MQTSSSLQQEHQKQDIPHLKGILDDNSLTLRTLLVAISLFFSRLVFS
jgi:hypothetical protein